MKHRPPTALASMRAPPPTCPANTADPHIVGRVPSRGAVRSQSPAGSGDPACTSTQAVAVGRVPSSGALRSQSPAGSGDPACTSTQAVAVGRVPSRGVPAARASGVPGSSPTLRWLPTATLAMGLAFAARGTDPLSASPAETSAVRDLKSLSVEELMTIQVATVYTASKHAQKATETPASVSVVTGDDIRKFGHRTLADALRGVRGLYVSYDRSYSSLGVRGFNRPGDYGSRILILIDGHRATEPIYNQALVGSEFPLDMDLVDRIEIVRGPGHTLYGDNAVLAVINVIPKRGAQIQGFEASPTVASFDAYSGRLTYGTRTDKGLDLLFSGTFQDADGQDPLHYPEFASVNNGLARDLDGQTVRQAWLSASYRDITLAGFVSERTKSVPTAEYEAVFDQGPNFVRDLRWGGDAKFARDLGEDWQLHTRLYLDGYRFAGVGPYATDDPAVPWAYNRDLTEALFWGGEVEISHAFLDDHRLSLGTSYRDDFKLRQRNWDEYSPPVLNVDARGHNDALGAFLQDEYAFRTNLTFTAGARYDYFSTFGSTLNPRAGVVYEPVPDTALKFHYAQAFRSPNAYEREYTIPGFHGNPDLAPEKVHSYELGWEQALGRHWRSTVALFRHDMSNFITPYQDDQGDFTFANLDAVRSMGAEIELEGRWARGASLRVSYTYADVEERETNGPGRTPANSPGHVAKAALSLPIYQERIYASLELQGLSERLSARGAGVPGFVVANLTLFSRELLPNLEASVSLYNLFDRRYADPVAPDFRQESIVQDGRTFRLKLTYRY
jgi:outer membrane receptor for ferrienterochelin and colicins